MRWKYKTVLIQQIADSFMCDCGNTRPEKNFTNNEFKYLVPRFKYLLLIAEINARACPTIGLSRGSRCSHDLSLLVS
jgi:hypothetical protein